MDEMHDPKSQNAPVVQRPRKAVRLKPIEPEPRLTHEKRTLVVHNFDWPRIITATGFLILCVAAALSSAA